MNEENDTNEDNKSYEDIFRKRAEEQQMEVFRNCKILYSQHACWECDYGWTEPLSNLSYSLETLNVTLGKQYGYKIVADQVKEKFGTLRFYFTVLKTYPWWTRIFSGPIHFAVDRIRRNTNFRMRLVDRKCVPTRMSFLWKLLPVLYRIGNRLDLSFLVPDTKTSTVIMNFMDKSADRLIAAAEKECYNRCEVCGDFIGTSWTARCETKGWIRYVCERCAKKHGWRYEKIGGGEESETVKAEPKDAQPETLPVSPLFVDTTEESEPKETSPKETEQ